MSRRPVPSLLLIATATVAVLALAGYQVTGDVAGSRLLGRLFGTMIEIERWLPSHREDIVIAAEEKGRGAVEIDGLPLRVTLPAGQVVSARNGDLDRMIREAAGERLRFEGTGAFEYNSGSGGNISLSEPARWTIDLLGQRAHEAWMGLLGIATLIGLAVVGVIALRDGHGRAALFSIAIGGLLAFGITTVVWTLAGVASGALDEPLNREVLLILRDGAWIGVRDSLAVTGAMFAFFLLAAAFVRHPASDEPWPGIMDESY